MEEVLLEVKSVSKKFEDRYVLENVDMRLENCQFIAILGHSGSGKSTMLNILSSVLRPSTGYVFYKGRDITKLSKKEVAEIRREYIGLVFQHYMLLPNLTIRENIEIGNKKDNKNIN